MRPLPLHRPNGWSYIQKINLPRLSLVPCSSGSGKRVRIMDCVAHGKDAPARWWQGTVAQAWLLLALVCGSVFGITAWRLRDAFQLELEQARTTTTNLARSMADHASVTVGAADIVLVGMVERLQSDGVGEVHLARMQKFLVSRVAAVPTIRHLVVASDQGDVLISSIDPAPPTNLADRSYFAFHRDHPDLGRQVGPPVQNRGDGRWAMTVSRRFNRADGTFGGGGDCRHRLRHVHGFLREL